MFGGGEFFRSGQSLERGGERLFLAVAHERDFDFGARGSLAYEVTEAVIIADWLVIDCSDDVAALDAGGFGGAIAGDFGDEGAEVIFEAERFGEVGGEVLDIDPEEAAAHFACIDDLVEDGADEVGWDGEADAVVAAGLAEDGGIDSDEAALGIDESAAGITGIDGGIGLDEVLVVFDSHTSAADCADDALGDRLADAEGVADGEDDIADEDEVTIGERGMGEVVGVDFEHGYIGFGVTSDDFGFVFFAGVFEGDFDFIGAINDVVVGEDVAIGGDDDTGAEATLFEGARGLGHAPESVAEEALEGGVIKERHHAGVIGAADGFAGEDIDHGWRGFLDHGGVAGHESGGAVWC
ncbi:MAG: hypothetical protein RI897_2679 [Verrucomicrobiota bacterium]